MAAQMVARLTGPWPVRLTEASSPELTSRTWCVSDGPVLAGQAGQVAGGCEALVRLVMA